MSTGQLMRKGLQVACARVNQFRKAKDRVFEEVPEKTEAFYEELTDETPMFEMKWSFPDPDTGKVNSGELVFNILGPDSIKKLVPLIEKMYGPKPRKKAGDGNDPPKSKPKDKTKNEKDEPPKEEKKDAPPKEEKKEKEPKKDPPKEEKKDAGDKTVGDDLFDD